MNPQYRFYLSINGGTEFAVNPVYKDLSKEYTKENGQRFFRAKLSGKLTFVRQDYKKISEAYFDSTFLFRIEYKQGGLWAEYWRGTFYKTDCEFDSDSETCIVTPTVQDEYSKILAGYENEMDLIQLAPEMARINYWKRPVFQFYIEGANTIGCFQMGVYWEQEATPTSGYTTLHNTYKFGRLKDYKYFIINEATNPDLIGVYIGNGHTNPDVWTELTVCTGYDKDGYPNGYKLEYYYIQLDQGLYGQEVILKDGNDNVIYHTTDYDLFFNGFWMENPNDPTDQIYVQGKYKDVWGRLVNDVGPTVDPQNYELPDPDITDTTGYKYGEPLGVSGGGQYGFEGFVIFAYHLQDEPTQYGQFYENGVSQGYYGKPRSSLVEPKYFEPISRNSWDKVSCWMDNSKWSLINLANDFRCKPIVLKDAYSFASAIDVVVKAIDPSLDFQLTDSYSYLMKTLLGQKLYITPKSNILKSEYDKPAYQAPVTLKTLMDAMRDMFNAYWFIEDGKFKIERVDYFANGRSYSGSPSVGIDLTAEIVTRNGKNWAYCSSKWKYEKSTMPERYEFGWMDDATAYFNGKPLVMLSNFVSKGQKESISVKNISTDINLMLLAASSFSQDGFAMLSVNNQMQVINYNISQGYFIQNGMLSFTYLEKNYLNYDLPCWYYKEGDDGGSEYARSIKKTRVQDVTFPTLADPDLFELIKTNVGNGEIQKMSINLSSRSAKVTLAYSYGSTE